MGRYAVVIQSGVAFALALGYYMYLSSNRPPLSDEEITKKYQITQADLDHTRKNNELLMQRLKRDAGIKDK